MTTNYRALCAEMLSGWRIGKDIAGPMNRAAAALDAEPEEDPIKRHCVEMLNLWDADCDIGMAMEHLRGMLADPKQSTEIEQP